MSILSPIEIIIVSFTFIICVIYNCIYPNKRKMYRNIDSLENNYDSDDDNNNDNENDNNKEN
jgi:hypothetical protein